MLKEGILQLAQRDSVRHLAQLPIAQRLVQRFVAGETLDQAIAVANTLNNRHISVSLDHLGENTTDAKEASTTADDYVRIIERIQREGVEANISVKLTALGLDIGEDLCRQNLAHVLRSAQAAGVFVRADMEGSAYTERTVDMVIEAHRTFAQVGTVMQTALLRTPEYLERLIEAGVRVRLVKGAYLEPPSIAYARKA
ncbi:MAG: proline dehydrogenase family protein, partial [Chloroflexota bacterium]|nr:proline dehydrogenase family protein [Chloroflexota bacterium]